jgi:coiled-coil and C2 domain-containing protein 2A
MKIDFPQRAKNPLITMLNGKRACITRLISAINIPFEKNEIAECLIRRFVSLIPLYHETSNNNCYKLNGVWLSNNVSFAK